MPDLAVLWPDSYFETRELNDPRRVRSYLREEALLSDHEIDWGGSVCDVGCSTGEFLEFLRWVGPRYGMEINTHARSRAEQRGVHFDRDITTESDFFDAVIFRGTVQHVPHPFEYIEHTYRALKPGGIVAFLQTPNAGSLCYRLWQELPASDDPRNYWMPSVKTLSNALRNFGFEILAVETPYWSSPYARPVRDHLAFCRRFFGGRTDFAFWGNMLNLVARKPA